MRAGPPLLVQSGLELSLRLLLPPTHADDVHEGLVTY